MLTPDFVPNRQENGMKTNKLQPYINALIDQIHIYLLEGKDTTPLERMVLILLRETNKTK